MTSELASNAASSPNIAPRTVAAAPARVEWPDGYSGWADVVRKAVQDGSGSVLAFPSSSREEIAVTGRQKTYRYFASHAAIEESAIAICSTAKNGRSRPGSDDVPRRAALRCGSSIGCRCRSRTSPHRRRPVVAEIPLLPPTSAFRCSPPRNPRLPALEAAQDGTGTAVSAPTASSSRIAVLSPKGCLAGVGRQNPKRRRSHERRHYGCEPIGLPGCPDACRPWPDPRA